MNKKGSGAMVAFTVFCLAGVIALFAQADLSIGHGSDVRQENMNPSSGAPDLNKRRIAEDMRGGRRVLKDGKTGNSRLKCCGRTENN
jgi:hypothetical protein